LDILILMFLEKRTNFLNWRVSSITRI
jgi:hypothetical protein